MIWSGKVSTYNFLEKFIEYLEVEKNASKYTIEFYERDIVNVS